MNKEFPYNVVFQRVPKDRFPHAGIEIVVYGLDNIELGGPISLIYFLRSPNFSLTSSKDSSYEDNLRLHIQTLRYDDLNLYIKSDLYKSFDYAGYLVSELIEPMEIQDNTIFLDKIVQEYIKIF